MDAGAILDEIEVRISALDPENPASLEELQEFVQSDALDADAIFTAMDTDVIWIPSDTGSDLTGIYANGGIYTGDAEGGIRTGNGTWYYKMDEDDAYYYNGEWADDMPNGYGSFGERFEGNFVDGVGNGTMYRISSDGENKWEFTVTDGVPDRVEIPEEDLEDWHYERLSRYTDTVKPEIIPYYVEYRDNGETQSIRRLFCWDGGLDQPFAVGGIVLDEFIRSCQTELPEDEIILAKLRDQLADYFADDGDWWRWFDNPEVRDSLRKFVNEEFDMETYQRITGSDVVWYPSDTGYWRYALYPNGGIYGGEAKNGIRVDYGDWWYDDEDGAISYEGDWQNDLPNGSGSVIFGNDRGWTDNYYEYEENVSEPAYGNFVNGVGTVDIGGTMQEVVVRGVDGGIGTANTGDVILDVNNLSEEQRNMLEVMDALNMGLAFHSTVYDSADPQCFWYAILYLTGMYSPHLNDGTGRMTRTEDWSLVVNESLIEEYATALFVDYRGIPALPEMYVSIQNVDDSYIFPPGERGDQYGRITSWSECSDGTSRVVTQIVAGMDDVTHEFEYTLVKNPYADQFENPRYLYSVADVKER